MDKNLKVDLVEECKADLMIFMDHKAVIASSFLKTLADTSIPVLERWRLFEDYASGILKTDTWGTSIPSWWSKAYDLNRYQVVKFTEALDVLMDNEDFDIENIIYSEDGSIIEVPSDIAAELEKIMKLGVYATVYDW